MVASAPSLEATWSGRELSHEEQRARFREQHAIDAAAQVAWEAEARRDYERRRESAACPEPVEGPGMDEGGERPAGEGNGANEGQETGT
jgi:hypothetical protein